MTTEAAGVAPLERHVRPVAWTLRAELDARQTTCKAHLWFSDPVNSAWAPLYDQASLDNARQAIYEAEAAQLMAPLRARIAELEATEEGAKVAFGHVVEQKRAAEKECVRLQGLLEAAYADIRRAAQATQGVGYGMNPRA